jgi:hypothetical protein
MRFSAIYGFSWDKDFNANPEVIADEWADTLNNINYATIKKAITKARTDYPSWPPKPGEFLKLCYGEEIAKPANHGCAIPGCPDAGTMSRATHGSNWICNRHYHEGKG